MSIHVCSCMHHGVGEWHLRYPGMSQEAAQGIADKINSGMLDGKQADRIAALEAELARVTKERDALLAAACTAYGHLWHVNNEPMAPIPIYTPEKAAYAARKVLRDLLTSEQRGDAINATQHVWGDAARKEKP